MQFDVMVLSDVRKLQRMLTPARYWEALERIIPRALTPALSAMRDAAPRGRTGKLSRGFDVRLKRVQQGLIHGLEVDVGARVPYGHLVHGGHRIVARGPQRKGLTRARRGELRSALKERRLSPHGRVLGYPFAFQVLQRQLPQAIGLIEKLLLRELER